MTLSRQGGYDPDRALYEREAVPRADILHIRKDLDILSAPELAKALATTEASRLVIVDLLACRFIDSTGIRVLVRSDRRPQGNIRVVVAEDSQIHRVLRQTGIVRILQLAHSVQDAIDADLSANDSK